MKTITRNDVLVAIQERSRSAWEIANPRDPLDRGTPDLGRLDTISRLVAGMTKARTKNFKLPNSSTARMRLTIKAQEFLEKVYGEGTPLWLPNLCMYPFEVHLDVKNALLFHALQKRGLAFVSEAYIVNGLYERSVEFADSLNAVFDEVRDFSSTREYAKRIEADRRRWHDRVADFRRYFRAVRQASRDGVVIRLELHRSLGDGSYCYDGVYDAVAATLTEGLATSSTPVQGLAWKIDFHPYDGFFGHLAIVVPAEEGGYNGDLLRELEAIWMSKCYGSGFVLDCSAPGCDLRYRGGAQDYMGRSLLDDLDAVIAYMAAADMNYYVAAGDHLPSSGLGSAPPVRQWSINAPENIPRLGAFDLLPSGSTNLN